MKKLHILTKAQREQLLLEWNLYASELQEPLLEDFHRSHKGDYTQNDFLQFLRRRLDTEGYWRNSGQS